MMRIPTLLLGNVAKNLCIQICVSGSRKMCSFPNYSRMKVRGNKDLLPSLSVHFVFYCFYQLMINLHSIKTTQYFVQLLCLIQVGPNSYPIHKSCQSEISLCISMELNHIGKKKERRKKETYQYRKQRGRDLVMARSVLVDIQHEESKKSARKADTQFSKKQNNISNHIYSPYSKDVVEDQLCCNCRSLTEAFTCDSNLHVTKELWLQHIMNCEKF